MFGDKIFKERLKKCLMELYIIKELIKGIKRKTKYVNGSRVIEVVSDISFKKSDIEGRFVVTEFV